MIVKLRAELEILFRYKKLKIKRPTYRQQPAEKVHVGSTGVETLQQESSTACTPKQEGVTLALLSPRLIRFIHRKSVQIKTVSHAGALIVAQLETSHSTSFGERRTLI